MEQQYSEQDYDGSMSDTYPTPYDTVAGTIDFFEPLRSVSDPENNPNATWSDMRQLIAFPGFGFLPRWYATYLFNFTRGFPEAFLSNYSAMCNVVSQFYDAGISPVAPVNGGSAQNTCSPLWDTASCFPATVAGQVSVIPCPAEVSGLFFDTSKNATRLCSINGDWGDRADYTNCNQISTQSVSVDYVMLIYKVGYSVSLLALIMALIIFCSFREMQCLRNKIHANLFITYVLYISTWISTGLIQHAKGDAPSLLKMSCVTFVLVRYFYLTTFFWMFVEGLYLFLQVKFPLNVDVVKLRHYLLIGWVLPFNVVLLWSLLVYFLLISSDSPTDIQQNSYSSNYSRSMDYDNVTNNNISLSVSHSDMSMSSCPMFATSGKAVWGEWAYTGPIFLLLACNMAFLISIMDVVIGMLRSESTTERHHQHGKAAKALLVIFPLLGISYIITLFGPTGGVALLMFKIVRALLLSLQGFVITLPYCFLNNEVRGILKQHWERWQLIRGVGGHRTTSGRNSFSMAGFYSSATIDTRLSMNPQGFPSTPELISLQSSGSGHPPGRTHLRPTVIRNGNNNGSNPNRALSPTNHLDRFTQHGSSNNSSPGRNGSLREVFVTIHENDGEVTTSLITASNIEDNTTTTSPPPPPTTTTTTTSYGKTASSKD